MRLALEELGGAWVKLGQMLAMRFDLLPAAYCDELFKLLNAGPPFPYDAGPRDRPRRSSAARRRRSSGRSRPASFAAASIGQVHRADAPQRRVGRGQGPASADPRERSRPTST